MDLKEIAARLDDEEILWLKYRAPISENGKNECVVRTDRLLDVAEDSSILYVEQNGQPVWVRADEVIEVIKEDK